MADPYYDNPTYSVIDSTTLEQSPSLTLTILLEAWPINSYPYATQLPSGSVLIIAGQNTASGNPPSPAPPPPPNPRMHCSFHPLFVQFHLCTHVASSCLCSNVCLALGRRLLLATLPDVCGLAS